MRIVRVVLSFSLLVSVSLALGGPYRDLANKLHGLTSKQDKINAVANSGIADPELETRTILAREGNVAVESLVAFVDLRAMMESPTPGSDAAKLARDLKSSPLYQDSGEKERANWLAGAADRVRRMFTRRSEARQTKLPNISGLSILPQVAIYFVWLILGAGILAFIVYALRFVSFGKARSRRARTVLEDDEPERTLDEWLALADAFERDGKFREAVRALYLACLLKFDERNVARFIRSQTNWEHLTRIETSPRRPQSLDFRAPTQAFDQVWYGHNVRGAEDVRAFRTWYLEIGRQLEPEVAP